jgi:hypothetical protein
VELSVVDPIVLPEPSVDDPSAIVVGAVVTPVVGAVVAAVVESVVEAVPDEDPSPVLRPSSAHAGKASGRQRIRVIDCGFKGMPPGLVGCSV